MSIYIKRLLDFVSENAESPIEVGKSLFDHVRLLLDKDWRILPYEDPDMGRMGVSLFCVDGSVSTAPEMVNPLLVKHTFYTRDVIPDFLVVAYNTCIKEDRLVRYITKHNGRMIGLQTVGATEVFSYWVPKETFLSWVDELESKLC